MADNVSKFDDQTFLIDFYKEFVKFNKNFKYNNFCQLTGDPSFMINKIFSNHIDDVLFKMNQLQISALVPKIRVFKVIYDNSLDKFGVNVKKNPKEVEFPFKNHFDVKGLLNSNAQRGVDAGIMSFSWEDLGTNEIESGLLFNANLKIFLQNVEAFNKDRGGIKFADLLIVSGKNNLQTGDEGKKEVYEDANYRIKVVAGWAVPNASNKLFTKDERKAIDKLQIPFFVTSPRHEIDFREDGSVVLNLDYVAAIDGRMRHKDADILYYEDGGKSEQMERLAKSRVENAKKNLEQTKKNLPGRIEKQKQLIEKIQQDTKAGLGLRFKIGDIDAEKDKLAQLEGDLARNNPIKNAEEELKNAKQNYDKLVFAQRNKAYYRIINKLNEKRRIFKFFLNKDEIENWVNSLDRFNDTKNLKERQKKIKENRINNKRKIIDSVKERRGAVYNSVSTSDELSSLQESLTLETNSDKRKKLLEQYIKSLKSPDEFENKVVNFFFLGDLIETALEIVFNPEIIGGEKEKTGPQPTKRSIEGDVGKIKPRKSNFNFILGPVELVDYDDNGNLRHVSVPMADIPVSLDLFNLWFAETVIKPLKKTYSLKAFFCDLLTKLINNMISPITYGPVGQFNNTNFGVSIFNAPLTEKEKNNGPFAPGSKLTIKQAVSKFPTYDNSFRNIRNLKQYFLLYHRGISNSELKGNYKEDLNNGIHHFVVGSQSGIIKNVNFNVDKIPGRKEQQIAKSKDLSERNFMYANVYNATVKMVGNPLFKTGMYFYINPIGLGFAKKSDAEKIGIGGYYSATKVSCNTDDGKFETIIEGKWQSSTAGSKTRIETINSDAVTDNPNAFELTDDAFPFGEIKKINDKSTETATGQKVRIGPLNVSVKTKPLSRRSLSIMEKMDF
jgi:hypothetical protein